MTTPPVVTTGLDGAARADAKPTAAKDDPVLSAAERAAEHLRRTSPALKRDEIRKAYAEICDRIARTFALSTWQPKNTLTRMVEVNIGDGETYARADKELPNSSLAAIRVLVDFETDHAPRPMFSSYVFYGRDGVGDEVVAVYNHVDKTWSNLAKNHPSPEEVLVNATKQQLDLLTERIQPLIRRMR